MRAVHIAPFYYPIIGGVEKVVQKIAEYLALKGYDVYVVTYNRLRSGKGFCFPKREIVNGVKVIRVKPDFAWKHGTYSSEIPRVVRELKPDIVHVHVWRHPHVFQIAKLKRTLNFKAILHAHAPFHKLSQIGLATWLYHRVVDRFCKNILAEYDVVIALTPYEKNMLVNKLGVNKDKIVVIPNAIDDEIITYAVKFAREYSTEMDKDILLFVGRISKEKNLELAVRALKRVPDNNVILILAGPDEGFISKLFLMAHKLGVAKRLRYIGPVYGEQKYKLYATSKVFVNPCIYEAFGISLLEAQSFGKPCVITGEGGQLYAAPPGRTSVYAKPEPKDYANAITLLLTDKILYRRLSTNAVEWAKLHAWSNVLKLYNTLYEKLQE